MLRLLLLINIIFGASGYAQQDRVSFTEAISTSLPKYKEKADKAYRQGKVQRAEFLFDSLVHHCLKGSVLDNFKVRNLNKKQVSLEDFEKPIYLITTSSWVVPTNGEIPALNRLADAYHDQIDFIMLFWDNWETAKDISRSYSKNIKVFYVDEMQNNSCYVIKNLKHSLGLPTSFLLSKEKQVVDIRRKVSHPYGLDLKKSLELNTEAFSKAIALLLIKDSSQFSDSFSAEVRTSK